MNNEVLSAITQAIYGYYAASDPATDRAYAVFASDKYEDHFYEQFFSAVL